MLTREAATALAQQYASEQSDEPVVVLDAETIDFELGWVFFYQSQDYCRTGAPSSMLVGNSPIIVNRQTGAISVTGTALPVEQYVERYVAGGGV